MLGVRKTRRPRVKCILNATVNFSSCVFPPTPPRTSTFKRSQSTTNSHRMSFSAEQGQGSSFQTAQSSQSAAAQQHLDPAQPYVPERRLTRVVRSAAPVTAADTSISQGFESVSLEKEQQALAKSLAKLCELFTDLASTANACFRWEGLQGSPTYSLWSGQRPHFQGAGVRRIQTSQRQPGASIHGPVGRSDAIFNGMSVHTNLLCDLLLNPCSGARCAATYVTSWFFA